MTRHLDEFSPALCRLMARFTDGRPMSTDSLRLVSRLTRADVEFIQRQPTWDRVTIGDAKKFLEATGNPNDPVVRKRWKVRITRNERRVPARRWVEFHGDPEESLYRELIKIVTEGAP